MEFEKAMRLAAEYLVFEERFMDPKAPQGVWICDNVAEVSDIQLNAVCLGTGVDFDAIAKCRPFFELFEYVVIVIPNASGFKNCKTIREYIETYGSYELLNILSGAEELPAYGLLDLSELEIRDLTKVPRTLSGFDRLDRSIGGFFAGELSVWTGKRGIGKSTLLSQLLLNAIDQGHKVCAYSGELDKARFREWAYLQAAGPEHIGYRDDPLTGKRLPTVNPAVDKLISEWLHERFLLFDLERNIKREGEVLSHCVGGYAQRHMKNVLTILFLRKTSAPHMPYVTIEMHGNRMVQCHGYENDVNTSIKPRDLHREFFDTWLAWLKAGSRRDKAGKPVLPERIRRRRSA